MTNSAHGFARHPDHAVTISKVSSDVIVEINNQQISRSDSALALAEANYPIAYYLPIESMPPKTLLPSDHTTYCPFKGKASYYHLVHNGKTYENAIWCYKEPYDEALAIKDHIAFYPNVATVTPTGNDE